MGLTSAQGTPQQQILKGTPGRGTGGDSTAVGTPTPSNFLDTIRKPNAGTGLKEHERVRQVWASAAMCSCYGCHLLVVSSRQWMI